MKQITTYISEKLKLSKNTSTTKYEYFPKTKDQLTMYIHNHILEQGNEVDLNDIDVSEITDMHLLFSDKNDLKSNLII